MMHDLAPITRHLRAKAGSDLLVVAVHHIPVFDTLNESPYTFDDLRSKLGLPERSAKVLFPALCAMGMIEYDVEGRLRNSALGRFLTSSNPVNLIGYTGLEKNSAGVLQMAECLKHDGPLDQDRGFSFVKDDEAPSPMDDPEKARFFTMALAGRARHLAPVVAGLITSSNGHLLDVAGGTGYYSFEWLRVNPRGRATVFDRPQVLTVTSELLQTFCDDHHCHELKERVTLLPGDMLTDPLPAADLLLAGSLFHDWPAETCSWLAEKFAAALIPGGHLWVHDSFLHDQLDGPLPVTDYSAMLFLATKGRAYSRKEFHGWFSNAGLVSLPDEIPTLMDYGLIAAQKPRKG